MADENGEDSRKRKMKGKGVAVEPEEPAAHQVNLFNLQSENFASQVPFPNAPPFTHDSNSNVQQVQNADAAPFESFTSMLAYALEDGGTSSPADAKFRSMEIDHMIKFHGEALGRQLEAMMEKNQHSIDHAVEGRTGQKLKEVDSGIREKLRENVELERKAERYKAEAERLQGRVMQLEQRALSLKDGLDVTAAALRRQRGNVQEDGERSFLDTESVGLVRLECMVCLKEIATVMIWPCRHICLCVGCDDVTRVCPVCHTIKNSSVKVILPTE